MRRWGVIISGFYAAVIFGFLMPVFLVIFELPLEKGEGFGWWNVYTDDFLVFGLTWGSLLVGGQALLLFLSVDNLLASLETSPTHRNYRSNHGSADHASRRRWNSLSGNSIR